MTWCIRRRIWTGAWWRKIRFARVIRNFCFYSLKTVIPSRAVIKSGAEDKVTRSSDEYPPLEYGWQRSYRASMP